MKQSSELLKQSELLPQNCLFFSSDDFPANFELLPAEKALTNRMGAKRLKDFKLGRYCARRVLKQLSLEDFAVLIGLNREPLWPTNIVGSISHCEGFALAVACSIKNLRSIGVDVELATPLEADSQKLICSPHELDLLREFFDPDLGAKIIFSVKESIYKCLFPLYKQWIDFLDVEIQLLADNSFTISLNPSLAAQFNESAIHGRWMISDDFIFSSCWYSHCENDQ